MSQRSKEILIYVLGFVAIIGIVVFFQYHPFHWWLIPPAVSIPLFIAQQRRQQHWDDARSRRERGDDLAS